jgi:putative heme-binding domain-containing protein
MVYRDTLLGDALYGNVFISEPVHNLVHRRVIQWDGVTMTPRKPADEAGREFLRSRDSWFRPTTIRTGPDGGIWIADMYRLVIEHPEWIADDVEKKLHLRAGHDKGRIYRLVPEGRTRRPLPYCNKMEVAQLVKTLASPNGTQRDMAHRALLWRADRDKAVPLLVEMVRGGKSALGRLHALCVLDGLGAVSPAHVTAAMKDAHPGVRRHAVRISERFAKDNADKSVVAALVALAESDRAPQVVMQLAYSLGEFDTPSAGRALGKLLARHGGDTYIAAAALSGISKRIGDVAAGFRDARANDPKAVIPIEPLIRTALGKNDLTSVQSLVDELISEKEGTLATWQFEALARIEQALKKQGKSLNAIVASDGSRRRLWDAARRTLLDVSKSHTLRSAALRLMASDPAFRKDDVEVLVSLLLPQSHQDLQQAAIDAIDTRADKALAQSIFAQWQRLGPLTRDRVVDVMLRRGSTTKALLEAVKAKIIDPSEINATHRQTLANHRDRDIATSAARLLRIPENSDRKKLIAKYLPIVKAGGDPERGFTLFNKTCAQCHRIGGHGHDVGPRLIGLKDKSPEFLTTHILDPDRAIEDKYRNYSLVTVDGKQFTGLLKSETATSVLLAGQNGTLHTILKKNIEPEGFGRGKVSMMPSGLEQFLDPRALADVVAFVIHNQVPPKSFPGNKPHLVEVETGGIALRLRATQAEIYGKTVAFEAKYMNLGQWASPDDRAQWRINVPADGNYDVYLDWAVEASTANNPYEMHFAGEKISGRVPSTGNWDHYRQAKLGKVQLKKGQQRVRFEPAGKPSFYLIDLREICLTPAGQTPPPPFRSEKSPTRDRAAKKHKTVPGNRPQVIRPKPNG